MKILKRSTLSLCPICSKAIGARIVEKDGKVFMEKWCKEHGKFNVLIEKDVKVYSQLAAIDSKIQEFDLSKKYKFKHLLIPITSNCNLNCPVCYIAKKKKKIPERSIKQIIKSLKNYKKKDRRVLPVVISGGEPTMRKDLPLIIKSIRRIGYIPLLATNGVKLANYEYVQKLKSAGLKYVILSFDSLSDKVYKKIHGREMLKIKLRAIKNLKRARMRVIISMLVVYGINNEEIKDVFSFCIQNRPFIFQFRLRSMVPIGRYIKGRRKIYLSELLNLLCNQLQFEGKDIWRELEFWKFAKKYLTKKELITIPCALSFHVRIKKNEVLPIGKLIKLTHLRHSNLKSIKILWLFIKIFGLKFAVKILQKRNILEAISSPNVFSIEIRSWPTKYDIDLQDMKNCFCGYLTHEEKFIPHGYYNCVFY